MSRVTIGERGTTGLQWSNYVNGRLLTAQDLSADQAAALRRDSWLGRVVGPGVGHGLEVSGQPGSSVLHVSPGTGVCPGGTAVHLDAAVSLDLVVVGDSTPLDGPKFVDCVPTTTATRAPTAGAYVLTMGPASSYAGQVPVAPSGTSGFGCAAGGGSGSQASLPTPCTSRWEVEDVAFSVVPLDGFTTPTTAANRRNLLAHWCYGSASLTELVLSGFTTPVPYGGIDLLADLGPGDLPLAVFDWNGSSLAFVDCWSARRRVTRRSAERPSDPGAIVGDARTAEGEARFLQFQDQLRELVSKPATRSLRALDVFPLLPPAGIVPIDPLATADLLVKATGTEYTPIVKQAVKQSFRQRATSPAQRRIIDLLRDAGGRAGAVEDAAAVKLGGLAALLKDLQQEVAALREELDVLKSEAGAGAVAAGGLNRQLAGALVTVLADTPPPEGGGVDPGRFFAGVPVRVGLVEHETVDFTIRRSWYDEPINLGFNRSFNVFFVAEANGDRLAPFLLFAKRQRGIRWIDSAAGGTWGRSS